MFGTASALVLLLVVPGPTNTLLMRAGMLFGFTASWRMAFIECLAYLLQVSVWGVALFYLSAWSQSRSWLPCATCSSFPLRCGNTRTARSILHVTDFPDCISSGSP